MRSLVGNIAQLEAGRQVAVLHEDGFEGIKKFLPPPSRRALVLCDPSYELKSDYAKVLDMAADSLKRRSEEHTSELQSPCNLVCRLLLEKKKTTFEGRACMVRGSYERGGRLRRVCVLSGLITRHAASAVWCMTCTYRLTCRCCTSASNE